MSIQDLPEEIFEKIFLYLDGTSLSQIRHVCRDWDYIYRWLCECNIWKTPCKREIPPNALFQLMNSHTPDFQHPANWRRVYRLWERSADFNNSFILQHKATFRAKYTIFALAIFKGLLITGNDHGQINLFNNASGRHCDIYRSESTMPIDHVIVIDLPIDAVKHESTQPHIIFTHYGQSNLYILFLTINNKLKYVNTINAHKAEINDLKVYDNKFAVSSADRSISLWEITSAEPSQSRILKVRTFQTASIPYGLEIWNKKLVFLDEDFLHILDIDSFEERKPLLKCTLPVNYKLSTLMAFNDGLLLFSRWDQKLLFLTLDDTHASVQNCFDSLSGQIINVFLWANILCLALVNGTTAFYSMKNSKELVSQDTPNFLWKEIASYSFSCEVDLRSFQDTIILVVSSPQRGVIYHFLSKDRADSLI